MSRLLAVLTRMALLLPTVGAEPSSEVAFDLSTIQLLRAADPTRGEALAAESKCAKCHKVILRLVFHGDPQRLLKACASCLGSRR